VIIRFELGDLARAVAAVEEGLQVAEDNRRGGVPPPRPRRGVCSSGLLGEGSA
jgi:hypothetical protein